ncbi:hypothetical protein ACA758_01800 [Mycoplasmopsis agassizii]|uniref:Uncharacterized protein n=1 Tax=Mycoplasmopsis agassizii TaxID=33922 RepID=A0ABX4H5I5_9BACT|nr:hypothetical protein [Mycoplasmopsis agassizii]PAF55154.1 hypothetical protein CJF60_00510 [Mycoplasmopsis agassizii]SMC16796.1 hypothetical protein SAMN02745179_00325 [Mycoplasmopsis agassizii]
MKVDSTKAYNELKELLVKNKHLYKDSENNIKKLETVLNSLNKIIGPDDASYLEQFKAFHESYYAWAQDTIEFV